MCIQFFSFKWQALFFAFFFFFSSKAISSLRDSMAMFDGEPDGSILQPRCQEAWQELRFTFRSEAGCCRTPQLRASGSLPVGASSVGSLPIWMQQVRGWISPQQLWNWHTLQCLSTVLFLLDFIKTPSVVRADKECNGKNRKTRSRRKAEHASAFGSCSRIWLQF